jgi:riboflavin kinase/FMN adenylyltransferase
MRVFAGSESVEGGTRGCILTVGNFDGLHLGHRELIEAVTARARQTGRTPGLYTFDPHPSRVLQPDSAPPRLMTWGQLERGLAEAGIELLIREPFTREFSSYGADEFLEDIIAKRIAPHEIFVGRDFHFGRGRSGSGESLAERAPTLGVRVQIIQQVCVDGTDVSSSRVRRVVAEGGVEEAARCLGRPYSIEGEVVRGDERGRTLGFPTANVDTSNELLPAPGVYATRVEIPSRGETWPAVTNIGTRPTFEPGLVLTEAHLLDFEGDLYGESIAVAFHHRIRDERRFSGPAELREQIARDAERARELLSEA